MINIQSQKDFWDILYFLLIILLTSLFLLVASIQTLKLTNWYIWILYSLFDWHFNHLSNEEKDHLNISAFSKSSKSRRLMILDQIKYPISYTIVDNVPSTYLPKMEREVRDFWWVGISMGFKLDNLNIIFESWVEINEHLVIPLSMRYFFKTNDVLNLKRLQNGNN